MKPLVLFFPFTIFLFFAACSSTQQSTDLTIPQLIFQYPLPAYPKPITTPTLRISLQIYVTKDGTVGDVRLTNGTGSIEWDSLAAAAILRWKYSPARSNGIPINIWLHQTAVVTFTEPQYITLAEILCVTLEQADSVFSFLEQGAEFDDLVMKYSVAPSQSLKGKLGSVNIQIYPAHVKRVLSNLNVGEWTEPLTYGERYAVFKRLKE